MKRLIYKTLVSEIQELPGANRLVLPLLQIGSVPLQACVAVGSVTAMAAALGTESVGQRKADELRLKGALANLRSFVRAVEAGRFWVTVKDREVRVDQAIYQPAYEVAVATLPKIQDRQLLAAAEHVLEQANRWVETVGAR